MHIKLLLFAATHFNLSKLTLRQDTSGALENRISYLEHAIYPMQMLKIHAKLLRHCSELRDFSCSVNLVIPSA